jgi:hypothetical protein
MPANNKQTTLDLNGPILSFIVQPSSISACGIVTFVGIATATFPSQTPSNSATPTGYISYKWYAQDTQSSTVKLTDGSFNGATISGSSTNTLTIDSPVYLNKYKFFVEADYIPSAYVVSGSDVTAGTARSTGNAINDPINSNTAVLTAYPEITIIQHPRSVTLEESVLRIIDGSGTDTYLKLKDTPFYNDFDPGKIYTIISSNDVKVDVQVSGAGGGSSYVGDAKSVGGNGGLSSGKLTLLADKEYKLIVGGAGGNSLGTPGINGGGSNTRGGGGGGYSGIFFGSVSQNNALIIAGGGGGGGTLFGTNYISNVYHVFNNSLNRHELTQTSRDITVNYVGASAADGLPCSNNLSYKHYQIIFKTPFTDDTYSIEITNIAQQTAGGGYKSISNSGISEKTKFGFRIWFCANGYNSYVRSFSIRTNGLKEGFNYQQEASTGGDGGGSSGKNSNAIGSGKAGTQSSGGIGGQGNGTPGNPGTILTGGSGAGGGGGGYYGGGGGVISSNSASLTDGGGGGGSGYLHPTLITDGSTKQGAGASASTDGSILLDFEPITSTAQEFEATFSVNAEVDDDSDNQILYQWQLNGVDLVDGASTKETKKIIRIPSNKYGYPANSLLRLPLWDKNSDSVLDLIDLTNVANTVTNTGVSWVTGGGKFYNGYAYFNGNSHLEISPTSDFNFGLGDFTVESWVYFTQSGINEIFSCGPYTTERSATSARSQSTYPTTNDGWYTRSGVQQDNPYTNVRQLVIRWGGTTIYDSSKNTNIPIPSSNSGVTVGNYTYFPISGRTGTSQYGWSSDYNNAFNVYRVSSSFTIRKNLSSQLEASVAGTFVSGGTLNLYTWHHVAVSRKEGSIKLFIDGKTVATQSWRDINIKSSSPVLIGKALNAIQEYPIVGRMQDFQVYGISKYTSDFTVPLSGMVDSSLVLDLPLWDEGTGTLKLTDLSPNKKTITDELTYGKSPLWNKGTGKFYGGAAYFNGKHYLNVGSSQDFNFGTGDFTLELWCKFSTWTTATTEVLVNVGEGGSGRGIRFALSRNSVEGATFYLADINSRRSIGTVSNLKIGTWRHLAVSKSSTSVKFYVDGKLISSTNTSSWSSGIFGGDSYGYIGLLRGSEPNYPQCYMQDLKIYKGLNKYPTEFTPNQNSSISLQSDTSSYIEKSITSVSGSKTKNLTISTDDVSYNLLRCNITHPTACNSPLYTNSVEYNVISTYQIAPTVVPDEPVTPRAILEMEVYYANATMDSKTINLSTEGSYSIFRTVESELIQNTNITSSDTICLYAKERDLYVEVEMYGSSGSGAGGGGGSNNGGEGGYSKIRFLMKKNEEYILRGIKSQGALWLYRKAKLIACVGQGGSSGKGISNKVGDRGGRGGGVGVSGENGSNKLGVGGKGGVAIQSGQLSGNGIFGSSSSEVFIYPEDSRATRSQTGGGGRTISCTKGVYWRKQGKTACEDLGKIKFFLGDGTVIQNSAQIDRGYKDGYPINQTGGAGLSFTGEGGHGATGGNSGSGDSLLGAGGGGSGYHDGSVSVIETTLGGNSSRNTRFVIRDISETPNDFGDFYQDSTGRILIFSAATAGKDPRTLTKTIGKVLPGTDACIDDARWQRFLELAATQDYRLTATLDGRTTSITKAQPFNIRRMLNANYVKLKTSLTDWQLVQYAYPLYCLAWDETNLSSPGYGSDYSILSWSGTNYYYGYYGDSSNSFFSTTTYSHTTANYWILPPGVPDF